MAWHSFGKFPFAAGPSVNAPLITPPFSLRLFAILCYAAIFALLLFGIVWRLTSWGEVTAPPARVLLLVFCYFALPILIALSISNNRPISRPLIAVYLCALEYTLYDRVIAASVEESAKGYVIATSGLFLIAAAWWLFRSDKLRVYYALISGSPVPADISEPPESVLSPGSAEIWFARFSEVLAPWLELIVVILVLGSVAIAVFAPGSQP